MKPCSKKIKGIGPKLANVILAAREEVGTFKHINELRKIEGIGKNKFDQIKLRFKIGE
jgi:competence protein ComEA